MQIYMRVDIYACRYACMHVEEACRYIFACMHACRYISTDISTCMHARRRYICICMHLPQQQQQQQQQIAIRG